MKKYIVFQNNEYHIVGANGFTPSNAVCPAPENEEMAWIDIVDVTEEQIDYTPIFEMQDVLDEEGNIIGEEEIQIGQDEVVNQIVIGKQAIVNESLKSQILSERETQLAQSEQRENDLRYLSDTDWYVVRFMETGIPMPTEITEARTSARGRL